MHPMDCLISDWTRISQHDKRIDQNALHLEFLGTWHYSQYRPFPEQPPFWDRLYQWLDHIPNAGSTRRQRNRRRADQQALFNFVPWLLFVAEEDLIAMYRAAYTGHICRWLLDMAGVSVTHPAINDELDKARQATWFGSLAGMDINMFCRVNGVFGQSYRPEFRFLAEFCDMQSLALWLKRHKYERIVIVEDIVGTGDQLCDAAGAIKEMHDFKVLFVPLFIAPEGDVFASQLFSESEFQHVSYDPLFVLPGDCVVRSNPEPQECTEFTEFRKVNAAHNNGDLGFGGDYGTLVLTFANCPDNVPPIIHEHSSSRPCPLFRRASREG